MQFDNSDACYMQQFRYAEPITVCAEIAQEMESAFCLKFVDQCEKLGYSEWQIEDGLESLVIPVFIGMQCYAICNYKGEGEGFISVEEGEVLPIFKSKVDSFRLFDC